MYRAAARPVSVEDGLGTSEADRLRGGCFKIQSNELAAAGSDSSLAARERFPGNKPPIRAALAWHAMRWCTRRASMRRSRRMKGYARPSARAYASVALAAALWGTWTLFLRPAAVDPRWASAIIMSTMAVAGTPLLARRGARTPTNTRDMRDWAWLAVLGVCDAGNAWLFFGALARTTVAIAVLSHYLAPALVSLMAPVLVGTPRQRGALSRASLGTLGLVLVLEPWHKSAAVGNDVVGAAFGVGSAFFYAVNVCAAKRLSLRFTPEEQLVYHGALSALILVGLAANAPLPTIRGAVLLVLAGALVGVSAAVLFVRGLARVPAEHASVLTLIEPVTAVAVGAFAFGERPGAGALAGGALVLGVAFASTRDQRTDQRDRPAR